MLLRQYLKTDYGRERFDNLKISAPVIGKLLKKVYIARFLRTLGILYDSGVPILVALKITGEVVGNIVFRKTIDKVSNNVKEGQGIYEPLRASGLFFADTLMMISSGEESGRLGEMLEKSADLYDKDIDYTLKGVTSLFEPLIIVVMGLIVGFIAVAILMPIFNLSKLRT